MKKFTSTSLKKSIYSTFPSLFLEQRLQIKTLIHPAQSPVIKIHKRFINLNNKTRLSSLVDA